METLFHYLSPMNALAGVKLVVHIHKVLNNQ